MSDLVEIPINSPKIDGADRDEVAREVQDIVTFDNAVRKLETLVQVLMKSLVPCLVATPLVYCGNDKILMTNHAEFRQQKKEQLQALASSLRKTSTDPGPVADQFCAILKDVISVRYPAMPEFYINDKSLKREKVKKVATGLCERLDKAISLEFISRIREIASVMLCWFAYKPVGRPYVYVSDKEWSLVSEVDQRKTYRSQIVQ